jgi:hypothetical protein
LLTAAFKLENKFFLSSALPENWQKISRNDMTIGPKPPATGRTTGPIKGDVMVSCAGRVEKATVPV